MSPALFLLVLACTTKDAEDPTGDDTIEPSTTDSGGDSTPTGGPDDTAPTGDSDSDVDTSTDDTGGPAVRPNVLVLSIDTFSVNYLGRYSGEKDSPFLDSLLAEGLTLDNHRSCSNWTYPSFVCALSGAELLDLGFVPYRETAGYLPAPNEITFFAEHLQERGYQSSLVSTNLFMSADVRTAQGYDEEVVIGYAPADAVVSKGLDFLDTMTAASEAPWLLHLHFLDLHSPYHPPNEYIDGYKEFEFLPWDLGVTNDLTQLENDWAGLTDDVKERVLAQLQARYRGQLRFLDDQLTSLFADLETRGALEDTVVVIFTDHGEQLFEHDTLGHDDSLYEEENRALASFWGAGFSPETWDGPTTHSDILPTLFDRLGWAQSPEFTGVPAGQAEKDRLMKTLFWRGQDTLLAAIQGDDKILYSWAGEWEYYNITTDPTELIDLGDDAPESLKTALEEMATTLHSDYFPDTPAPTF